MLIVPQEHRSCEELRVYTEQVPTVFLSEDLRDEPLSCVTTDNTWATYLAMEYLRSLGHREILYFGRRHTVTHQLRAEGYLRACRDMGLTPRIVDSSFPRSSVAGGYELARELFTKPPGLYGHPGLHGLQRPGDSAGGGRAWDQGAGAAESDGI